MLLFKSIYIPSKAFFGKKHKKYKNKKDAGGGGKICYNL
mgnify:CR=1 FL=1